MTALAPKPLKTIGVRHKQSCIMFFGLVVAYMQRENLSVGLVAMTDPTVNPDMPIVNYTTSEKGELSSMFFYGYLVTAIPAGLLADKLGPIKLVGIIGGIFCGMLTVVTPYAALNLGYWAVCAIRIVEGLGQGFFYPCMNTHMSKWAIPEERGQFNWIWTGAELGTAVMSVAGGQLAAGASGWPSIFHYSGIFGVIWGIFCLVFGADSPSVHGSITEVEKNYILSHLNYEIGKKPPIPWCALATSIPFIVIAINFMCLNWGFFTLLTFMPTYLHGVYNFSITANGFLTALPYIGMLIGGIVMSGIADQMTGRFTTNFIRKFFNTVGMYGPAAALLILSIFTTNATGAMTLLTVGVTLNAGVFNGMQCNHLDLAPNLAGIMMGITNGLANVASITAPTWAGYIVQDESDVGEWQTVFLMSAAIFAIGNTIFLIWGSTELQPWNDLSTENDKIAETGVPNDTVIPEREEQQRF